MSNMIDEIRAAINDSEVEGPMTEDVYFPSFQHKVSKDEHGKYNMAIKSSIRRKKDGLYYTLLVCKDWYRFDHEPTMEDKRQSIRTFFKKCIMTDERLEIKDTGALNLANGQRENTSWDNELLDLFK